MINSFEDYYQQFMHKDSRTIESLLEMPQHYASEVVTYQKDSKFSPVSPNNLKTYRELGFIDDFIYLVHPNEENGYVINVNELERAIKKRRDVLPAMVVSLRDTKLGIKQAHALRTREKYSRTNVATNWYVLYVKTFNAIVSDFEHLEGGMLLWRSLIDKAYSRLLKATTYSFDTGETKVVDADTPYEEIWSKTPEKRNVVIILQNKMHK